MLTDILIHETGYLIGPARPRSPWRVVRTWEPKPLVEASLRWTGDDFESDHIDFDAMSVAEANARIKDQIDLATKALTALAGAALVGNITRDAFISQARNILGGLHTKADVLGDTVERLIALQRDLASGSISRSAFASQSAEILSAANRRAASLVGRPVLTGAYDARFLAGFAGELVRGEVSAAQAASRAAMWAGDSWGTYNSARIDVAQQEDRGGLWHWILCCGGDGDDATCESCFNAADGSPYSADDVPGGGDTTAICDGMGACRCELEWEAGSEGGD